ncbi:hypothetical protein CONPUDRAFT_164173 [Coniophora puteana RWD-64-598 SS2]|uniref:Uncharacterized protein n=1 Tax=Coniophora puteana (strain RWD-64-598) TaxID=741705 RepID=A0A5M3MWQ1_CONPW|nr:uncharacterized protein CONPUDRAFT_164173 [Coniophora puteana RWD-64-598 SS2]EIW83184.1 hypothetical protein CONPUDRAFT_164173 [Coniophora puteana RWD-64-598 SS2]
MGKYVDAETQTTPAPPVPPHDQGASFDSSGDDAYIEEDEEDSLSPLPVGLASRRNAKYQRAGLGRGPGFRQPTTRVVSMPENSFDPLDGVPETARIVSLPERYLPSKYDLSLDSVTLESSSFLGDISGGSTSSRRRIHSRHRAPSDVPRTPSPPSSLDSSSIIIEHDIRLSDAFMRRTNFGLAEKREGWQVWASSPPRPIPALHGPLSLPYARCPSGAEGTIIEEPDHLPRMIWGLGAHEQGISSNGGATDTSSARENGRYAGRPRGAEFSKNSKRPVTHGNFSANSKPAAALGSDRRGPAPSHLGEPNLQLPGLFVMGYPHNAPAGLSEAAPAGAQTRPDQNRSTLAGYLTPEHSPIDWGVKDFIAHNQGMLANHQANNMLGGPFRASQLHQRVPRIFVEPRPDEIPIDTESARSRTALELALELRKHAQSNFLHLPQSGLPTPPNSSSPLWSPGFSPYSTQTLSPEVEEMAYNLLNMKQDYGNSMRHTEGPTGENYFLPIRFSGPTDSRLTNFERNFSGQPSSHRLDNGAFFHGEPRDTSQLPRNELGSIAHTQVLSPMSPMGDTYGRGLDSGHAQMVSTGSLASQSPELRPGSFSQQPRSIPLARLMQRRLSAVPEEDPIILDKKHAPQSYHRTPGHQHSTSQHGTHPMSSYHQKQDRLHSVKPSIPPPRTSMPDGLGIAGEAVGAETPNFATSPAKVRLPHTSPERSQVTSNQQGRDNVRFEDGPSSFRGNKKKYRTKKTRAPSRSDRGSAISPAA